MKKFIVLIAVIVSFSANAQQKDLIINDVGVTIEKTWDLYGDYDARIWGGGTVWGEKVKEGVRTKMERINISECDYEAFKANNGMYILMAKNEGEWYDCTSMYVVFRLFQNKSEFDSEVSEKVKNYNREKEAREYAKKREIIKKEMINGLGF